MSTVRVLNHHGQRIGLAMGPVDFTDTEAIAAIGRITNGNFRLVQRLFTQIHRSWKLTSCSPSRKKSSSQYARTSSAHNRHPGVERG